MMARAAVQAVPWRIARRRSQPALAIDYWLLGTVVLLLTAGLVMVASASVTVADRNYGEPLYFFWRQARYIIAGIGVGLIAVRIPMHYWHKASGVLVILTMALLVLVLIPGVGREVNGSMRWLYVGQPSEPMKLAIAIYLASYLVRHNDEVRSELSGFIKPMLLLVVIALLLLLEPDYGATVVMFATVLGMMLTGGVPLGRFTASVGVVVAILSCIVLLAPYRVERLMTFMNPWLDPYDSGFQLTQALIAFGRGEWFGVGLGASVQKLFYLPEAHTDFMFAIIGEEFGLIGVLAIIGLYAFLLWRAFSIGRRAEQVGLMFHSYLALGLGLVIGLQAYINMGVNVGVLPTKGLTLPLMSYGGSSMLVSCTVIALLLRIDYETRKERASRPKRRGSR